MVRMPDPLSMMPRMQLYQRSRIRSSTTGYSPRVCGGPQSGACGSGCITFQGELPEGLCVSLWLRTKRTLGLGSLYGENDLLELDRDPLRERHVAEKQLAALGDIL